MRLNTYQTRNTGPPDNPIVKYFTKIIREDRNDIDAKHDD